MIHFLQDYLNKPAEIVFEWNDPKSEAKGWLVINSLTGGAAGGGTRMRKGLTRREVEDLAKTMEIKFKVCGPSIGGAKSGIDFDPQDPRKEEVLQRWFTAIKPLLSNYYGTAGDLNIDERKEVRPFLLDMGINHPQFGVLEGHFHYPDHTKNEVLEQLKKGCALLVKSEKFNPSKESALYSTIDLITGYGVYQSIVAFYKIFKQQSVSGKRVAIQGWGNVGAAAGWYLSQAGAKLVLIQDKEGFIVNNQGFDQEVVSDFMNQKINHTIPSDQKRPTSDLDQELEKLQIDLFIPAAASKLVAESSYDIMKRNGLELIACGANVPFKEEGLLFGPLTEKIDRELALIPDFIANCGVARLFAYLMQKDVEISEEAIFQDIEDTMQAAISQLYTQTQQALKLSENALRYYAKN
jgi:glutamate dehydrogenase/leucine dehydrogenase